MTTAIAVPGNTAATFLTHIFGTGLVDDTYVVERFKARADGDIRPWSGVSPAPAKKKGRRGAKRATASLKAVRRRAEGLCTSCGNAPAAPGRVSSYTAWT